MRALYSRVCALTLVAGALSFLGCVVLPRREPGLTMTSHRVPQPKPESCPATITASGASERGAKPFTSSDDLRRHTGTTVWFAADGRLGDWGKEHKYHFGEPVVLCAAEPFENEGRVASKEVLDAQNVLVKTADGAFFNAPIADLSMAPPRFDKSQVTEGPATAENACAMFLEYLDAKTELAANPESHGSAPFDRTKPAFWAKTDHKFQESVRNATSGFGHIIEKLDDRDQFKALEPLIACSRAKPDSDACVSARALAQNPPAAGGNARKGGQLILRIRPIVAGTKVLVDGHEAPMVDGRVELPFTEDGQHSIEVTAPGRKTFERKERVTKGDPHEVPVMMLPD